jgi:hypothetical protein
MAHYAFLDENNIVTEVIVGKEESNFDWENFYGNMRGQLCKRTSYNTHGGVHYDPITNLPSQDQSKAFRKNYAGLGYAYNPTYDGFIPPKPYESWILDTATCLWLPPTPCPGTIAEYEWDEKTLSWVKII